MRNRRLIGKRQSQNEAGIALLIAIFILLLICVVSIALVISSGTESALAGNYRSATSVQYAAVAGLEEVRARLRPNSANYFRTTDPTFLPPAGTPLGVCNPIYVLNPLGGEAITPWDPANPYHDNQFSQEFGGICPGGGAVPNPSPTANSIWDRAPLNGLPFPGPSYKWVRINGVYEKSMSVDTCPFDTTVDLSLVYYGVVSTPLCNPNPPHLSLNDIGIGSQVLEITALAVLPNNSRKLVQYLVARVPLSMPPFLAAVSLLDGPGNSATFHAPAGNASYAIKGDDQDCSGNPTGAKYPAVGVFNNPDQNAVINGIPSGYRAAYTGLIDPGPDIERIDGAFPGNLQSPAQLDAMVQAIIQNADVVITPTPSGTPPYLGTATGASLTPLGMSSSNPLTVVVNGNLDISNWSNDGYGLLLVTGTFTYDPDTTWDGIILVIGQGVVGGSHMQFKQINGAMLVAKTRDSASNQVLSGSLLGATVSFSDSMQGNGVRYSSCWIQRSTPTSGYKILSFHEIPE